MLPVLHLIRDSNVGLLEDPVKSTEDACGRWNAKRDGDSCVCLEGRLTKHLLPSGQMPNEKQLQSQRMPTCQRQVCKIREDRRQPD